MPVKRRVPSSSSSHNDVGPTSPANKRQKQEIDYSQFTKHELGLALYGHVLMETRMEPGEETLSEKKQEVLGTLVSAACRAENWKLTRVGTDMTIDFSRIQLDGLIKLCEQFQVQVPCSLDFEPFPFNNKALLEKYKPVLKEGEAKKIEKAKQRMVLMKYFLDHIKNPFPTKEEKEVLGEQTGMQASSVDNWFKNIRKVHWLPVKNGEPPKNDTEIEIYNKYFRPKEPLLTEEQKKQQEIAKKQEAERQQRIKQHQQQQRQLLAQQNQQQQPKKRRGRKPGRGRRSADEEDVFDDGDLVYVPRPARVRLSLEKLNSNLYGGENGELPPAKAHLKCEHCEKVFATPAAIRYHKDNFVCQKDKRPENQPTAYKCEKCERYFTTPGGLKYHTKQRVCGRK